jgi:hypothetical protein
MRALSAIAAEQQPNTASGNGGSQAHLIQALDTLFAQHWVHAVPTHQPEVLKQTLEGLWGAAEAERSMSFFLSFFFSFLCLFIHPSSVRPSHARVRHHHHHQTQKISEEN